MLRLNHFFCSTDNYYTDRGYVDPKLQRNSSISSRMEYLNHDPSFHEKQQLYDESVADPNTSGNHVIRRPSEMLHSIADYDPNDRIEGDEMGSGYLDDEYWEDEDEEDENRFVNFALLSHMAVQLRDKVVRETYVKGSIPYLRAFTGKDIVVNSRESLYYFRLLMIPCCLVNNSITDPTRVGHQS